MTDVGLGVGRGGRGDERGGGVGKGGGRGVVGKGKGGGIAGISIKTLAITSCFFFLKRRAFCHYRLSKHSLSVVFPIDVTVTLFQYVSAFSRLFSLLRPPSPPPRRSLFSFPSSLHRIFRLSLNLAGFSLDRGRFERAKRFRRGWLKGEGVGKRRGERERMEGQERREEE